METLLLSVAYLIAAVLFIMSLKGLSSQETARGGNLFGVYGMVIALVATALSSHITVYVWLALAIGGGAVVGIALARRVAMTAMPELVALLHSFVGAAAVLVGVASYLSGGDESHSRTIWLVEIAIAVFIGAITFTGSIMAYLKLKGSVSGRQLLLPGRHALNIGLVLGAAALSVWMAQAPGTTGIWAIVGVFVVAGVLGVHLVAAIGGADMPVVVSMLNSYSGWTASAAGFMLSNDLLIITGALVGSSGAILSVIMCKAMNRSIVSVIFGGFGAGSAKASAAVGPVGEMKEITADDTVEALLAAKAVVIVPGYGMAVARAQHAVRELTEILRKRGILVRFAIHPVAGRLPGHMNVLLAEANVPYDIVLEMDEINHDLKKTDVVLVLGANDIVNPSAETDPASPIAGMPVLRVWEAALTVVSKRGKATGYAGVDNPLFYMDKTRMLFGDAKDRVEALVRGLNAR